MGNNRTRNSLSFFPALRLFLPHESTCPAPKRDGRRETRGAQCRFVNISWAHWKICLIPYTGHGRYKNPLCRQEDYLKLNYTPAKLLVMQKFSTTPPIPSIKILGGKENLITTIHYSSIFSNKHRKVQKGLDLAVNYYRTLAFSHIRAFFLLVVDENIWM